MKNKKITKNTTLREILKLTQGKEILKKYGLPCLNCPLLALEIENLKIGEVSELYGIDIEKLLQELNQKLKQ